MRRSRVHGLDLRSAIPLFQARPALTENDDIVLDWGTEITATRGVPTGRVIAEASTGESRFYTLVATPSGYVLRYHGICDFEIDAGIGRATCRLEKGADAALVPVLAAGGVLATMLILRGELVLHASAVEAPTGALAFVGESGMGKSTLATLLALAGAPLLADDVLRVGPGPAPMAYAGATETRLREGALGIVDGQTAVRKTADGRTAVASVPAAADVVPLATVVVPFPSRETRRLSLTRVSARDALLLLVRFPRVLGWKDQETLRRQFAQLGELAEAVPVFLAQVPWGPPFPQDLAAELLLAATPAPGRSAAQSVDGAR